MLGAFMRAGYCRFQARRSDSVVPVPPGSLVLLVYEESEAAMAADRVKADGTGVPNHRRPPGPCHVTPITRFFTALDYRGTIALCMLKLFER